MAKTTESKVIKPNPQVKKWNLATWFLVIIGITCTTFVMTLILLNYTGVINLYPSNTSNYGNSDNNPAASTDNAVTPVKDTTTQPGQATNAQPGQGAISIESVSTTIAKIHQWPETRQGEDWAEVTMDISGSATASALLHPGTYYGHVSVVWLTYPQDYHVVTDSPYGKQYIDAGEGYFGAFPQVESPWGYEYDRNSEEPLTIHWTGQTINAPFEKGEQIMIIAQLNWPSYFSDFYQATYEVITPFP